MATHKAKAAMAAAEDPNAPLVMILSPDRLATLLYGTLLESQAAAA